MGLGFVLQVFFLVGSYLVLHPGQEVWLQQLAAFSLAMLCFIWGGVVHGLTGWGGG